MNITSTSNQVLLGRNNSFNMSNYEDKSFNVLLCACAAKVQGLFVGFAELDKLWDKLFFKDNCLVMAVMLSHFNYGPIMIKAQLGITIHCYKFAFKLNIASSVTASSQLYVLVFVFIISGLSSPGQYVTNTDDHFDMFNEVEHNMFCVTIFMPSVHQSPVLVDRLLHLPSVSELSALTQHVHGGFSSQFQNNWCLISSSHF